MKEPKSIIKKAKRRKAGGPDELNMEILKELDEENRKEVLELMNIWWEKEEIPEEQLRARVVLISKKRNTNKYENYRPITARDTLQSIRSDCAKKTSGGNGQTHNVDTIWI